jgi:hypothetical protein
VTERVRPQDELEDLKKHWGAFRISLLISATLIIAMWGLIIRGGEPPPSRTAAVAERPTVLLFLIDTALRRYAHYEKRGYPEQLSDIDPKYVPLRQEELSSLERFPYSTNPAEGYHLGLIDRSTGNVTIVLSPQGIVYMLPSNRQS